MKLEKHKRIAKNLRLFNDIKWSLFLNPHEKLTKKQCRPLLKAINGLNSVKADLDGDFHQQIDDKQFKKLGHIYYSPKERA